ncbi:hypothetical protein GN244_ATG03136 [Phytophthora infestans]|uniref:Uncharacterized protein n=1 Tax=Phytophthora infestans TaxID=4787 RepID=A0A833TDL6_PHYIN|nr:hypothetical protein GN244_ATG03136 [Phytophthora infestans]KAF4137308.1 hypothetical protein GN958_ATG13496 [Phytophthora infestans]KAF4139656.1 hypothetical protein GN958_ATG11141 [Phytophthora infestans]
MFATLSLNYKDDTLATMIHEATKSKSTKTIAKKLQLVQFGKWKNEGLWPGQVVGKVFYNDHRWGLGAPPYEIYKSYLTYWSKRATPDEVNKIP